MLDYGFDVQTLNVEMFDKLAAKLTLNTEYHQIITQLESLNLGLSKELIEKIADFRKKNRSLFSKWHSFIFESYE